MKKEEVAISVLMSTYNAAEDIRESIESILQQTFSDFEFLIIDDASTDDTAAIVESFKDDRIRFYKNSSNQGLTKNLIKGISLSKGKYIARMDSDDISMNTRFQRQFDFMENNTEVGVCGTWYETFGDVIQTSKYKTEHDLIILQLLYQSHLCHSSVMIRKNVLEQNQISYDPDFYTAQDYDLWTRIARVSKIANIPEVLHRVRFHTKSVSSKLKSGQLDNRNKIILSQLNKMGVSVTVEEIELFVTFCHSNFDFNKNEFQKLEEILVQIIEGNNETKYIEPQLLNSFLGEKWFHACYNFNGSAAEGYKKYDRSRIALYCKPAFNRKFKFYIKKILPAKAQKWLHESGAS